MYRVINKSGVGPEPWPRTYPTKEQAEKYKEVVNAKYKAHLLHGSKKSEAEIADDLSLVENSWVVEKV